MYDDLAVLGMAKQRMDWVAQRHQVLAQNVANADTPGYKPRDLEPLSFKETLRSSTVGVAVTHPNHVVPATAPGDGARAVVQPQAGETAPNGNAVVLEDEMTRIGEAKSAYELAANLFKKQVGMLRTAIGRGGGG